MGVGTNIEWTDTTWPIVNGCRRKSAGCQNCYSERLTATRLKHMPKYKGLAVMTSGGPRYTGETRLWLPDLGLPLKLRKPQRIFVANMGDLFFSGVSDADIDAVFGVMAVCSHLTFQVLSKRPERMLRWFERATHEGCVAELLTRDVPLSSKNGRRDRLATMGAGWPWPLPNVHVGVSVEDQETADERIPLLLQVPAAVHWISAEPLLGPIDFHDWLGPHPKCSWLVGGSESGPGARPMDHAWLSDIIAQCRRSGARPFTKQIATTADRKGGKPEFWPAGDWPREFPHA